MIFIVFEGICRKLTRLLISAVYLAERVGDSEGQGDRE